MKICRLMLICRVKWHPVIHRHRTPCSCRKRTPKHCPMHSGVIVSHLLKSNVKIDVSRIASPQNEYIQWTVKTKKNHGKNSIDPKCETVKAINAWNIVVTLMSNIFICQYVLIFPLQKGGTYRVFLQALTYQTRNMVTPEV